MARAAAPGRGRRGREKSVSPAGRSSLLDKNGGGINMLGVVITPPQAVPEPGVAVLAGVAALVLGWMRRR